MKHILPLLLLSLLVASSSSVVADKSKQTADESAATNKNTAPGSKKKGGVPPGLQKKGGLPPGQAKKQNPPPTDLLITNAPATNEVARPAPSKAPRPVRDSKRVESPRGTANRESLPPEHPVPAREAASQRDVTPAPATAEEAAKLGRELGQQLKQLDASWLNLRTRKDTISRMATETGVPPATITQQFEANPRLRGSDLLMGNKIAATSGKAFDEVMAAYQQDKDWVATGGKHGVSANILLDASKRVGAAR